MTYRINEVFYTLQGEGYWSGRAAVFCRLSGCNLWDGLEANRAKSICRFCDTDFLSYHELELKSLVNLISDCWRGDSGRPMVVFTGGEPALQLDEDLVRALKGLGFYVAIETNGTIPLPGGIDWICVSPKTPKVRVATGDELKLVYPQIGTIQPETYARLRFDTFWLSPMDGPNLKENTAKAVDYVLEHPQWRLNTQTHKKIGIR